MQAVILNTETTQGKPVNIEDSRNILGQKLRLDIHNLEGQLTGDSMNPQQWNYTDRINEHGKLPAQRQVKDGNAPPIELGTYALERIIQQDLSYGLIVRGGS